MKLKTTLQDAVTPSKLVSTDNVDNTYSLQMEIQEKNEILYSTEKQVDCLLEDVGRATNTLNHKESLVDNLKKSVSIFEGEKKKLRKS